MASVYMNEFVDEKIPWVVHASKAKLPQRAKHSIHAGRTSQATASKHRSSHDVCVRVRVRLLVGVSVAATPTTTLVF